MILVVAGLTTAAVAGAAPTAPEIDAISAVSALSLIGGAVLVIRSRKK
jgi:hypothetical protein